MPSPHKPQRSEAYRYTSMSVKMAVVITAGAVGGNYLDHYFHVKFPVFTLVLTLLSVFLAIYIMIIETKR